MRKIPEPNDEHSIVFDACISNLQDATAKNSYIVAKPFIMSAGINFLGKAGLKQLSTISPATRINGMEMKEAMVKLYNNKLAKKGQPGRVFYDKWRTLAPNGKCPLCGVKQVSTLDHYLSKSDFPTFAIYPFNLIPACRDCNTEKLAHIARNYAEETLHPYFDDIDQQAWLVSAITLTQPVTFSFSVRPPADWSTELISRVKKHMEVFKLNDLFSSHAAEELTNISFHLRNLHRIGGESAVKAHLYDALESRRHNFLNSWQTAMYTVMYHNTWFHANGFIV